MGTDKSPHANGLRRQGHDRPAGKHSDSACAQMWWHFLAAAVVAFQSGRPRRRSNVASGGPCSSGLFIKLRALSALIKSSSGQDEQNVCEACSDWRSVAMCANDPAHGVTDDVCEFGRLV